MPCMPDGSKRKFSKRTVGYNTNNSEQEYYELLIINYQLFSNVDSEHNSARMEKKYSGARFLQKPCCQYLIGYFCSFFGYCFIIHWIFPGGNARKARQSSHSFAINEWCHALFNVFGFNDSLFYATTKFF